MTIKDKMPDNATEEYKRLRRKANQHWDMAGEARVDGDKMDEKRHTDLARDYERQAREALL